MTRRRPVRTALVLIATALLFPAAAQGRAVTWSPHAVWKGRQVNLGPTGARGWVEGHRIHVVDVAPGSPADGVLQPGDVLIGANATKFAEGQDPRVALGNAVTESETAAKAGKLTLLLERDGEEKTGTLGLRVMGSYSTTWPFGCAKSAKILTEACARLAAEQYPDGHMQGELGMPTMYSGLLFLASNDARYLDNARRAAYWLSEQSYAKVGLNNWPAGYCGLFLAEYYLATGDRTVLPQLEKVSKLLTLGMMRCGSWGHSSPWDGYGAVNQVGLTCLMALILTKECGVAVDEAAMQRSVTFFEKFAGKGWIPYGDHSPWRGDSGNGKNALGAVVFQLLGGHPDTVGEFSRSVAASYPYREEGHTGCYFSIFWGPLAAVHAGEKSFRTFLDHQRWYYDLARTHDGGLICQPNAENLSGRTPGHYTWCGIEFTTGGIGLVYAMPLKSLRILGAGSSVFGGKLPAPLEKARTLFEQRKWKELDASLAGLVGDRHANQLAEAAKRQKRSVELTLRAVENHIREGDVYRASELLKSLERLLGKDCPELADVQKLLAANDRWVEEGRKYYEAWSTLRDYTWQYWHFYGQQAKDMLERDGPPRVPAMWTTIAEISEKTPQTWKALQLGKGDTPPTLPKDWFTPGFDDSAWANAPGPMHAGKGKGTEWTTRDILLRRTFALAEPSYTALRLKLRSEKGQVARVYLNGTLVAEAHDGARGGYASIPLDGEAARLLKSGRNTLAVHCANTAGQRQGLDLGMEGVKP